VSERESTNIDIQRLLLDIYAARTRLPIGLFDVETHRTVFGDYSLECFEPYCRLVRRLPGGNALCERDQRQRAKAASHGELTLCHAGLYDYALPIHVDGQLVATLLCGEMRIADRELDALAVARHEQFLQRQQPSIDEQNALRQAFSRAKSLPIERVNNELLGDLHSIERWYYRLTSSQRALTRQIEDVTHELQIWLQGLLARAEILCIDLERERDLRREYREEAREVLNSALALDVIVQSFGDFLRSYRFAPVSLRSIVNESRRVYEEEAKQRGIEVRVELESVDGRPPMVEASKVHLQHAIHNLVHNAIKYSFAGGFDRPRWVQIAGSPAGQYYQLSVQNFGVGIDPDEYDKIFEGGYQGRRTVDEYRPGGGRGLRLAKRIIERHHGQIRVSSIDQKSAFLTTFTVFLPFIQPAGEEDAHGSPSEEDHRLDRG